MTTNKKQNKSGIGRLEPWVGRSTRARPNVPSMVGTQEKEAVLDGHHGQTGPVRIF